MRHVAVLRSLRAQRFKALQEALELRKVGVQGTQAVGLRGLCKGLLGEIRALDAAIAHTLIASSQEMLLQALQFYADPESYLAIGFFPDRPCGPFIDDFGDTELGFKPGRRAREVIEVLVTKVRQS